MRETLTTSHEEPIKASAGSPIGTPPEVQSENQQKRSLSRKKILALLLAVGLALGVATPAAAHFVRRSHVIYHTGQNCVKLGSEISHGTGGGYSKANLTVYKSNCSSFGPQYTTRVRVVLYKWHSPDGSWRVCRDSGYAYGTREIRRYWGNRPPCGTGTYGTASYGHIYNGGWKGGYTWSGSHWLG